MTQATDRTPAPVTLPAADDFAAWLDQRCAAGSRPHATPYAASRPARRPRAEQALRIWDDGMIGMGNAASVGSLFSEVHPDEAGPRPRRGRRPGGAEARHRAAARPRAVRRVRRPRRRRARPAGRAAARQDATDFRRAGVDRDDETRARIKEINEQLTLRRPGVQQEHPRRQAHHPGRARAARRAARRTGSTPIRSATTAWSPSPPTTPTRSRCARFCRDREVRREMVDAFLNVGWPDNEPLLRELFELREELARLVGYDTWADYDAGVKMIGKGAAIPEFIDRITEVAQESAERDRDVLLARLRLDHPDADRDRRRRLPLLRGAGPQGAVRRRRPGRAHLLRLRRACAPACSTSPAGCST